MENMLFGQMLVKHSSGLMQLAQKFTKDADDAKDLIQDTLLKAILNSEKYTEGTSMRGWLYTIMKNRFISQYRNKRRNTCPLTLEDEDLSVAEEGICVDNAGESSIAIESIKRAMYNLPEQYYQPINMYVDGYKYEEITQNLVLPIGTIKNRIHLARKILKTTIK